jgi:4-hydroxy-3-polyprenylbenzoate decarboxylase
MASLRQIVDELAQAGHLVRLDDPIDPCLEAAEIQRRVYLSGGPAILFANVTGCRFPMVSNLFGTIERARYIFRHTYEPVRRAIEQEQIPPGYHDSIKKYFKDLKDGAPVEDDSE